MSKQSKKNLSQRAGQVQNETQRWANSAQRVGGLLKDAFDSVAFEWDAAESYEANQLVLFKGQVHTVLQPTTPGQSPDTHGAKYQVFLLRSGAEVTDAAPNYPVTKRALMEYVTARLSGFGSGSLPDYASADKAGIVRKVSSANALDRNEDTAVITPKYVYDILEAILENIDLQTVAENGASTDKLLTLLGLKLTSISTATGSYKILVRDESGVVRTIDALPSTGGGDGGTTIPNPVAPSIGTQQGTQGVVYSFQVPAFTHSLPLTYTATGLPAGLAFNAGNLAITGTPQAFGQFNVTVTATDSAGRSSSVTFILNIVRADTPAPADWLLSTGYTTDVNTKAVNLFFGLASGITGAQVSVENMRGVLDTGNGRNGAWSTDPNAGTFWQALSVESNGGGTYNFIAAYHPTSISPLTGGLTKGDVYRVKIRRNPSDTPVVRYFLFESTTNINSPLALTTENTAILNIAKNRVVTTNFGIEAGWDKERLVDDDVTNTASSVCLTETGSFTIEINFAGLANFVSRVELTPRNGQPGAFPADFLLQFSTAATGDDWSTVVSRTAEPIPTSMVVYTFGAVQGVRRFRLVATKLRQVPNDCYRLQLGEIRIMAEQFFADNVVSNQPPVPPIVQAQTTTSRSNFSYVVPAFTDPNNDALTYALVGVQLFSSASGTFAPTSLDTFAFNPATRALTRNLPPVGRFKAIIRATDTSGANANLEVPINVNPVFDSAYLRFLTGDVFNGQITNSNTGNQSYVVKAYFFDLPASVMPEIGIAYIETPNQIAASPMSYDAFTNANTVGNRGYVEGRIVSFGAGGAGNGAGYIVYIRAQGYLDWTELGRRSWANQSDDPDFVKVYPRAAVSELANQTYQGVTGGGFAAKDPNFLNITWAYQNGRVVITGDANPTPPAGYAYKYLVKGKGYFNREDVIGMSFRPGWPILIQKYLVDLSRPQSAWRDNPLMGVDEQIIMVH